MATMTILIRHPEEEKKIMDSIIEKIDINGEYRHQVKNNVRNYRLILNEMVQHDIVSREYEKAMSKSDEDFYVYREGPNFLQAKLQGAKKFIKNRENELNPSESKKAWEYSSNNPLISGLIGAIIGGFIVAVLIYALDIQ